MPTKNVAVQVKATGPADDTSLDEGQFVALASVFNNVDLVGDKVMPGAFTDDLKEWKASGDTIPLYWGHRMDDPHMCIGGVLDATETDTGLQVKAALDLDNPVAQQVYKLLKGRRVGRMSFAYDVVDGAAAEKDGQQFYELRKLKLHEVSVVQVPANPEAEVLTVKNTFAAPLARPATDNADQVPKVLTSQTFAGLVKPDVARGTGRKARIEALTKQTDAALTGLLGQADQAIDDAAAAIEQADQAMDAILAQLGVPDLPDEDEAEAGSDGGEAPKRTAPSIKTGRTISAKNEKALREALSKFSAGVSDIKSVLAALDSTTSTESGNDGKASPGQPAGTEEPDGVKVTEPARPSPASMRLRADLANLATEYALD